MLDYDPTVNLQHYPGIPMKRFGLTPYMEPLFRIVFAPSRRHLAGDDSGFQWLTTYPEIGNMWVLERWSPPRYSKDDWDSNPLLRGLGPYQPRGEYFHCHTFHTAVSDANLMKLVAWIEEGRNRRYSETRQACVDAYADDARGRESKKADIIQNALPAFGTTAFAGARGHRGTKTNKLIRSANELGLPIGQNKFISRPKVARKGIAK